MTGPRAAMPSPAAAYSPLDRVLRLAGDIRPGEGARIALLITSLFILLVAYYLLKTVREPLILTTGGAEVRSYAAAAQAALLMLFVPYYGRLAARVDRTTLVRRVLLGALMSLELLAIGAAAGVPGVGVAFYVWVGMFSVSAIAQFWSVANDLFSREDGERLFPVVALGATAGSPVGAWIAASAFGAGAGPGLVLQAAAALIVVHLVMYGAVDRAWARDSARSTEGGAPLEGAGGFQLVVGNRYLRGMAALVLCLNIANTLGEYIVGRMVLQAVTASSPSATEAERAARIGAFYGDYFFWVNLMAVALQVIVASRLVRRFGARGAVMALPVVAFGTYGLIALGAGFAVTRWAKSLENAIDYSIMNTGRQLLWLPTTRAEKYKAKQAVDTFVMRAGDVIAAGCVYLGTTAGLDASGFATVNTVVVVTWLVVTVWLLAEYRRLCADCP